MGLASPDLLLASRVRSALGSLASATLEVVDPAVPAAPWALLLIDLNRGAARQLQWLRQLAPGEATRVICFGPHTELAALGPEARAAGADRCVANSHLAQALASWARHQGSAGSARGGGR